LQVFTPHFTKRGCVRGEPIRDQHLWLPISPHQFPEHFQCSTLVPALGDDALKHLAFVINRTPKVMPLTVDFHEDLVDMPLPSGKRAAAERAGGGSQTQTSARTGSTRTVWFNG
jgi:hypothetical protein